MNKNKIERVESLLNDIKQSVSSESSEEEGEDFSRERYLSAFDETCERFGIELDVELEEDESKDDVYSEWNEHVNVSASELQKWSKNPCSRQASVDPVAVIKRNLRLLERNKEDWTSEDVEDAKRTISFISRMKAQRPDSPREGPHGCPSEWAISLLNWAYNPFSSIPTPSSEVKDDLEAVEKVTLQQELGDGEGPSGYEFEPIPDQVLYSERSDAMDRAKNLGLDGVHEHVMVFDDEEVTMYMPGDTHRNWEERVRGLPDKEEEMSETRQASEVVHGNEQERKLEEESEDDSVRVPPVAIHKVDGGSSVQVEDDVEQVLDELWEKDDE